MNDDFEVLTAAIVARRHYGKTTYRVRNSAVEPENLAAALDAFVADLGFRRLGDDWIEVTSHAARVIAATILQRDLAYGDEVMAEIDAQHLSDSFLGLFGSELRAFTNGNLIIPDADPSEVARSWNPITQATFDTGVVCAGCGNLGILWVEDED